MGKPLIDLTGQKFGFLTVKNISSNKKKTFGAVWLCECDCGNTTEILGVELRRGHYKSCGCRGGKYNNHGKCNHRFFQTWARMIDRCYNQNHKGYKYYGQRGITVCDEWKNDPIGFCNWCDSKEPIPEQYTLDRIDNNSNYCPENCHFVSMNKQSRNRRDNILIEHNGETLCYKDFVEKYGIVSYKLAYERIKCIGMSYKEAALTPKMR